jgi:hypothetical protein
MITKKNLKQSWDRCRSRYLISQHETFTQLCLPNCFYQNKTYIQSNDNKNIHIHEIDWIKQKLKKLLCKVAHIKNIIKKIIIFLF